MFVQEEAGQLFRDIALAISAAVGLSLVVSMTVIPTAAARLFHRKEDNDEEDSSSQLPSTVRGPFSFGNGHSHDGNGDDRLRTPSRGQERKPWYERIGDAIIVPFNAFGSGFVAVVVGDQRWIQRGVIRQLVVVGLLVGASFAVTLGASGRRSSICPPAIATWCSAFCCRRPATTSTS